MSKTSSGRNVEYINPYKLFTGSFVPQWIESRSEISPGAKLCYARLCRYAGRDGICYPKQETLAEDLGISDRQIRRYLAELEKYKLLVTVQSGLNKPNFYRFLKHSWMDDVQSGPDINVHTRPDINVHPKPDINVQSLNKENHRRESYKDMYSFYQSVLLLWNKLAQQYKLTPLRSITPQRKKILEIRLLEEHFDFEKIIAECRRSDYLLGKARNKFYLSFDKLIQTEDFYTKILEGAYRNREEEKEEKMDFPCKEIEER